MSTVFNLAFTMKARDEDGNEKEIFVGSKAIEEVQHLINTHCFALGFLPDEGKESIGLETTYPILATYADEEMRNIFNYINLEVRNNLSKVKKEMMDDGWAEEGITKEAILKENPNFLFPENKGYVSQKCIPFEELNPLFSMRHNPLAPIIKQPIMKYLYFTVWLSKVCF